MTSRPTLILRFLELCLGICGVLAMVGCIAQPPTGARTPTQASPDAIASPTSTAVSSPTATATLTPAPDLPATTAPDRLTATPTSAPPTLTMPAATSAPPLPAEVGHFRAGEPIQLDTIRMINRGAGWGIRGAYLFTTQDGGLTWREATPPTRLQDGVPDRLFAAFLDQTHAWAIYSANDQISPEAVVWHTADGGGTWAPGTALMHQAFGEQMWAEFAVLDFQNIWLMVRGVYVGAGTHHTHQLFHSADGGLSWSALGEQTSRNYTGMVFADPQFGLRTLQTTGAYAPSPPAYTVTFDGGVQWEERELPPPPDAPDLFNQFPYCETYQPVLLSNLSIRMLVGCFDYYAGQSRQFTSYFYTSQDGGLTWKSILLPRSVRAYQDTLLWFGLNNALLLGRDMHLSASDGLTWDHIKTVNWDGQFSFTDPQYGWAAARADGEIALVRTTDWAKTWEIIEPVMAP